MCFVVNLMEDEMVMMTVVMVAVVVVVVMVMVVVVVAVVVVVFREVLMVDFQNLETRHYVKSVEEN